MLDRYRRTRNAMLRPLVGTILLLGGAAATTTVEPATAPGPQEARVKAIIERFLDNSAPPLPESSGFEIDRNYALTQDAAAYLAYLPKAAWVMGTTRLEFGPLTFRIQPRNEGLSTVNFSFGDLITLREGGKIIARLLIGKQQNQGIWDDTLQNFTLATWRLGQIKLVVTDAPMSMSLDNASFNQTLSRSSDAAWSRRQILELADLTVQLREDTVSIERIVGQIGLDGENYQKLLGLRNELSATAPSSDAEATQKFLAFLDGMEAIFSRFDANFTATDLTLSKAKGFLTTIKRITIGNGFKAQDENGSMLNLQIELADLETQSADVPSGFLPISARLELGFSEIPAKLLSRIMKISLASEQIAEKEQEDYLDQAFAALFLNSNLELHLKDSYLETPNARLDVNAHSTINSEAALGGIGEFNLRIEGLDKILDRSANLIDKDTAGPFLAVLVALSNRTQIDGKVIDSFAVRLSEDGKLWLNGKDVTALVIPSTADPG